MTGATIGNGTVVVPLSFEPYEAKLIVLGPMPTGSADAR
jgi:hypothetical protein